MEYFRTEGNTVDMVTDSSRVTFSLLISGTESQCVMPQVCEAMVTKRICCPVARLCWCHGRRMCTGIHVCLYVLYIYIGPMYTYIYTVYTKKALAYSIYIYIT